MRYPNLARDRFVNSRPLVMVAATLACVSLTLTAISAAHYVRAKRAERVLTARLAPLEKHREKVLREVETINGELEKASWSQLATETAGLQKVLKQRQLSWTRLLGDLERVVPWDVRLVSIGPAVGPKGDVRLNLIGVSTGREAWLTLLARLFSDSRFSEPMPRSEEAPSATNAAGYRFQVSVRYWPEGRP
jgi:Tfp pilus assembly protein PilN